ncbi:gliding motility-associated C-terminal domain-containing protein [uncultured Pedobacter sp.]|uniref:T9SS type B sorting domain-containing protein n=1 Tax=uncultured Pedobacter sp. TaxID=246139 RepID=UPI0025EAB8D8|nr:gliding motility-associated C-terminal domain-containing protein [uncultured Pedobacter sp.]
MICFCTSLYGQTCPENIGFEKGSFLNWKTFTGSVSLSGGKNTIVLSPSSVIAGRHSMMTSATDHDMYGGFPVLSPNGSGHAVKLGSNTNGKQAEGISYLINVPDQVDHFTITYQYAVVFQAPNHTDEQQPRFDVKLLDVSTGAYIECASFKYIATSGIPGFKASTIDPTVIYKDWTPVTIDLSSYKGKTLSLEFTTADCTEGGHFGYAYVDVDEQCESVIVGNVSCEGAQSTRLKGPSGYQYYKWYNEDKSKLYGEGETLEMSPALPSGTKVLLDLSPFAGFGCPNTVTTTISTYNFQLDLIPTINSCENEVVDLTSSQFILNKSDQVSYAYYADDALQQEIADPQKINVSGVYYVKAKSPDGCISTKSVTITFHLLGALEVLPNFSACGKTLDLTSGQIQKKVPQNAKVSYFSDVSLQTPVTDPRQISTSGDYFIRYQFPYCIIIKKVALEINPLPNLKITNPAAVCLPEGIDLTKAIIRDGSDPDLTFSYYMDVNCTEAVADPTKIKNSGVYYIRAVNDRGCSVVSAVKTIVNPPLILTVANPEPVCEPATIDITNPDLYQGSDDDGLSYQFMDATGAVVNDARHVAKGGTYYISVKNNEGCTLTKPMDVVIYQMPKLLITQPGKVFISDKVDLTNPVILKGSSGYTSISYWKNAALTETLEHPESISRSGRYYISLHNASGCLSFGAVDVVMVQRPKVNVPTVFTPLKEKNNTLFPFYEGIKRLNSFKVFNKWGNMVFETNLMDMDKGWDGTCKNQLQPFETYTWFVDAVNELDERFTKTGKTILLP